MESQTSQCDVLIVGAGLAGTLLARALDDYGLGWKMVADPDQLGASSAAGALVNPLTGRRFTQPPELDWLWQGFNWAFANEPAWQPQPILRLFRFADQHEAVRHRRADPAYRDYLGDDLEPEVAVGKLHNPHGGVWVSGGGVLAVRDYLQQYHRRWQKQGRLLHQAVNVSKVKVGTNGVQLAGGLSAKRVVFCEGAEVLNNPWFGSLPIHPIKGEILIIRSARLNLTHPVIGRQWLIPRGDQTFVLGATHERGASDAIPSSAGRKQLLDGLQAMLGAPDELDIEVLEHRAGVRPGRSANRAILGFHPDHPSLGVFNGLGSKGCLLGPAHARLLASHIADNSSIPVEINVENFLQ